MAYVNYGQYAQFVMQQSVAFLQSFSEFKPCVEQMQLPGDPYPANMLMFKGNIKIKKQSINNPNSAFAIKIILVTNFPFRAPKVYVDQQLDSNIIKAKNYLGNQNEITIAYLSGWNMSNQPNLKDMMTFIDSVFQSDPPVLNEVEKNNLFNQQRGAAGSFNP